MPTTHQRLLGQIYGLGIDIYRAAGFPEPGGLSEVDMIEVVTMIHLLRSNTPVALLAVPDEPTDLPA